MMKKIYTILVALFIISGAMGQGCLPDGITFETQAQIDSFQINYPNCTEIEGDVVISGAYITNLYGLSVLTSIGGSLTIYNSDALTSLTGLDNLTSIGGSLNIGIFLIGGNNSLTNLSGLENVTSIGGDLGVVDNDALTSLTGLEGLTSINGLFIVGNNGLTSLTGLENLTSIEEGFDISSDALTSLMGLDNLTSIGGYLLIYKCDALTSLAGLDNVTSISFLYIYDNYALTSLTGLEGLTSTVSIQIEENPALTSLTGLDNIESSTIEHLSIFHNFLLSTCEILSICNYLASPNGNFSIHNNFTGCNSPEEVQDSCEANAVTIGEIYLQEQVLIYPNPAHSSITIELPTQPSKNTSLTISNTNGQQLITQPIIKPQTEIDISDLPTGIYIVKVWNDKDVMVRKVIKQ